jgi:hypothetical protein
LDPDDIVPPAVPGPPAPLVPRARTNSFTQPELEPVILEPPVTTNPLLCRPTLPPAEISTIRRLSARVNVLPVVARADTLTNDRLAAVKLAIRRDLAEAGIGFGIFDMDGHYHLNDDRPSTSINGDPSNGYSAIANGSSSRVNSPPTSPANPSLLRLPYALISPDIYSHSDGVTRMPLSRHELVNQYTPSSSDLPSPNIPRGKLIRSFRWGCLDVLDPNHCDFIPLRAAIFHHMEVWGIIIRIRVLSSHVSISRLSKNTLGSIYLRNSKLNTISSNSNSPTIGYPISHKDIRPVHISLLYLIHVLF